jgi:hypothetical protein
MPSRGVWLTRKSVTRQETKSGSLVVRQEVGVQFFPRRPAWEASDAFKGCAVEPQVSDEARDEIGIARGAAKSGCPVLFRFISTSYRPLK